MVFGLGSDVLGTTGILIDSMGGGLLTDEDKVLDILQPILINPIR